MTTTSAARNPLATLAQAAENAHNQDVRRAITRRAGWAERFPRLWCTTEQGFQPWVASAGDVVCQSCGRLLIAGAAPQDARAEEETP